MAGNVSKWRLNKTETKQLEDETKAFYDAQITAGMDKKDAQKERDKFYDTRSRELKSLKAAKSASKKAEQKRGAPEVEVAGKDDVAMGPDFNSDYYTAVMEAKKVILDNPIFCRIEAEAPLPIKEGDSGVQAVFSPTDAETALKEQGCYRAGINLFWCDFFATPTPGVPLSLKRTMAYAEFIYGSGPRHTKYPVVLAVGLASDLVLTKGTWKQCSPEELLHSFLLKLSSRISANCDDEELKAWKQVALSYPAQFEMISGEDAVYWEAWKNRQLLIQSSDTVKRTARQLCWEVHGFKEKKQVETGEVISIAKLQDLYSKARTAESNKTEIQDNFVSSALSIHEKLLADDEINRALDVLEERYSLGSCLNSLTKLKVVIEKTEDLQTRRWAINCIVDLVESNVLSNEQVTKVYLQGSSSSASAVELFKFKQKLSNFLLDVELARSGFDQKDLSELRKKLVDHKSYRKFVSPYPNDNAPAAELTWQSNLKASSILCLKLVEDLVFGTIFNGALVAVMKRGGGSRSNPAEMLEVESFSQRLQQCIRKKDDELAEEKALLGETVNQPQDEEDDEVTKLNKGAIPAQPGRYAKGSQEFMAATAAQTLAIYASFLPEADTINSLAKQIRDSPLGKTSIQGQSGKNCVFIHFDADLASEAHARPNYRPPPMTEGLARKLICGALRGRGCSPVGKNPEPDVPCQGDVLCILDGGRDCPALMTPFKQGKGNSMPHYIEVKDVTVVISEDSVRERKQRCKTGINQVMRMRLMSNEPLEKFLPERKRSKFQGSTKGNVIGFVGLSPSSEVWKCTVEEKQAMYGDKIIGGDAAAADEEADDKEKQQQRKPTDLEPFNWSFLPRSFYSDCLQTYSVAAVLDLTPGQGELCRAALSKRIPYVGVAMTALHADKLREQLTLWLQHEMITEGSSFYNAEWVTNSKKRKDEGDGDQGQSGPKLPKTNQPKPKPKPKTVDPKTIVDSDEDSKSNDDGK